MATFEDLHETPRRSGGRGLCAWCGAPAAAVVELRLSRHPRGDKRDTIASLERRLCENHAVRYYQLLETGPRRGS